MIDDVRYLHNWYSGEGKKNKARNKWGYNRVADVTSD